MRTPFLRAQRTGACVVFLAIGLHPGTARGAGPVIPEPPPADASEVRFTVGEAAILDWLKAATPYTLTLPLKLMSMDLVFSEPRGLQLKDGNATLTVKVQGNGMGALIDQVMTPVFTLSYDARLAKYYAVVSSMPLDIKGVGRFDLKDSLPRVELPGVMQDLWTFPDRPVGLSLDIRRIAIRDHALEIGANVRFAPLPPSGPRAARQGGTHDR